MNVANIIVGGIQGNTYIRNVFCQKALMFGDSDKVCPSVPTVFFVFYLISPMYNNFKIFKIIYCINAGLDR